MWMSARIGFSFFGRLNEMSGWKSRDSIALGPDLHAMPKSPIDDRGIRHNQGHSDAGDEEHDAKGFLAGCGSIDGQAVVGIVAGGYQIRPKGDAEQSHQ